VQDNVSYSVRGVLRGLHLQHPRGQGKLVSVLRGEVFDVAVDVRRGSPTFGCWAGYTLSAENARQLYIPAGFAHGFAVTGDDALVVYKVTCYHHPAGDVAVAWDDPDVGVEWPVRAPISRSGDRAAPRLRDLAAELLPAYAAPASA
jgi:dTDP-4-dehydrorhamnose 3,5-epimerase